MPIGTACLESTLAVHENVYPGLAGLFDQQSQTLGREQVNLVMPYVCARQAPGFAIHFNGASPG